jgi:hypothetical protein
MIPLARWLCKIARHTSHTVQRERSEKATRRKGEGGEPLIRKQALDGAPNDTGPTSRLPETVPLQNKNGRSQDESRIPHVDPAWAAFLQQPDGGPIMCGEVHHRGDCRASPQRADRTQQSSGKNDPNITVPVCLEGRQKLLIWCILRKEGLANIRPPIGAHCPDLIHSQPLVSGTQASSKSDKLMFRAPPARPLLTS